MINNMNLPDKIFGVDSRIILLWLQPLGLVLVLIISLFAVIIPKINEISTKVKEIKSVAAKTVDVNQKRTYLQTVDQTEALDNAKKMSAGLLPEKNSYLLVRIIRDAASKSGYYVDDFSISMGDIKNEDGVQEAKKSGENYDTIPVNVTLVGPANNYITLVKTIERSLPVMSISKFEMKSQNEVSTIKLNVLSYYLRDISDLKLENLTLTDLTPSQDEATLLNTISEYQNTSTSTEGVGATGGSFVKYERTDPFSTL